MLRGALLERVFAPDAGVYDSCRKIGKRKDTIASISYAKYVTSPFCQYYSRTCIVVKIVVKNCRRDDFHRIGIFHAYIHT